MRFSYWKNALNKPDTKNLLSNIMSLGILQAVNYLLPLLTVPYLVRVLGPENFGLLAFATATIGYFILITDYGFNLSATRQISIHRDDHLRINKIFSAAITIKFILAILSFFILIFITSFIEKFQEHQLLYLITFGLVIGQSLFPVWLFQGMERMRYIAYVNLLSKVAFTLCIFIFVKNKNDYLLVPLFNSLGYIFAGAWSLYLAKKFFHIRFLLPTVTTLKEQLYDGWHIFLSSLSISAYTISTTFILGLVAGNTQAGYFSAAEKVIQAAKGIYTPISQAIFPMISKAASKDRKYALYLIRNSLFVLGGGMLLISALLYHFSDLIITTLLGDQYLDSANLLRIMAFVPFAVSISNILGIQTMLNFGYKKAFTAILVCAAITGLSLSFILVPQWQSTGTAITLISVELFVSITMMLFLFYKQRLGGL